MLLVRRAGDGNETTYRARIARWSLWGGALGAGMIVGAGGAEIPLMIVASGLGVMAGVLSAWSP